MADDEIRVEQVELSISWSAADAVPAVYANQFLTSVTPDEVVMVFGQITPPAVIGGPESVKAYLESQGSTISVQPVAKITFNPTKLQEIIDVLVQTSEKLEIAQASRTDRQDAAAGSKS